MSNVKWSILIVEGDQAQRKGLTEMLGMEYSVSAVSDGAEAKRLFAQRGFDLVIVRERASGHWGMELLKWLREETPETPVIFLAAGDSEVSLPITPDPGLEVRPAEVLKNHEELRLIVARALHCRVLRDLDLLHRADTDAVFPAEIISRSREMQRVLAQAEQVAPQSTSVLLTGEPGAGKESVARYIHRRGQRREGPFVVIRCAALSEPLLESEIFGEEKSIGSGKSECVRGRIELAHGGTLFLDEVGSLGAGLQDKLLKVIRNRKVERIGGKRALQFDVRIITATSRDLRQLAQSGTFREDLLDRLSEFPIHIPPLRQRREAILPLAEHFARQAARRMGRAFTGINVDAASLLYQHDWPGNVRELANAMERALIVAKSDVIRPEELPLPKAGEAAALNPGESLAGMEKSAILDALARNSGHRRRTAEELGISLRTLQYRLKDYGLVAKE